MLREVPVWFEVWRQLNGFPPSVAAPAGTSGKKAGPSNEKGAKA
jgi:hypothetical protein